MFADIWRLICAAKLTYGFMWVLRALFTLSVVCCVGCQPIGTPEPKPDTSWIDKIPVPPHIEPGPVDPQPFKPDLDKQLAEAREQAETYKTLYQQSLEEENKKEAKYTGAILYHFDGCSAGAQLIADLKKDGTFTVSEKKNSGFWVVNNRSITCPTVRYYRDDKQQGDDRVGYGGTKEELQAILKAHPLYGKASKKAAVADDVLGNNDCGVPMAMPVYVAPQPRYWQLGPFYWWSY